MLNECLAALNSRTGLVYLTCLMLGIDLEKADRGDGSDLRLLASDLGRALSQLVLRTDVSGMPLEWIDYKEAARLYHQEQVAYTCGSPLFKLYGGVSARTGFRTVLEVNSIVATIGHTGETRSGIAAVRWPTVPSDCDRPWCEVHREVADLPGLDPRAR